VGRSRSLLFRADSLWQTTVFYTPFNDVVQRQRPYALLEIGAEFGPTGRAWSVAAYVRNLTNQDYITGTFATPVTAIGGRPGEPRQLVLQFAVRQSGQARR
jgi:outer membrane receptor protein involved in Fe transport